MQAQSFQKWMILFAVLVILIPSSFVIAKGLHVVKHIVQEDETGWFLASVYYGNGAQFTKLLGTNHLTRAEDIKAGMEIQIESPKYFKEQIDFANRYARLWDERQKKLGLQSGGQLPKTLVVIPTETIRSRDSLDKLPSIEVQDRMRSSFNGVE